MVNLKGTKGKILFIGIVFVILLSLFLHFREVRTETLELNATSDRYVTAQVDFTFPDEEATQILKQESVRDVGAIYKISEKQIRQRTAEFEKLLEEGSWRISLKETTFEELYKSVHQIQQNLLESRYTDVRTLQKMKEIELPNKSSYIYVPSDNPIFLPVEFWNHTQASAYLLNFFEHKGWSLQEDISLERILRQKVQERVPEVITKIEAGTRLIEPGEKVEPRHLAMLKAMKGALIEKRNLLAPLTILGSLLLSSTLTLLCVLYLRISNQRLLRSPKELSLLASVVVLTLILAKGAEYFLLNQSTHLIDIVRYPILVPFASLLTCVLIGAEVAFFISAFLAVILGMSLAIDHDRFLVINLTSALVTIICAKQLHKRKEVFAVCGKVWLSSIVVILAFNLTQNNFWHITSMTDLVSTLVFLLATALLVVGLLPIFESLFSVMTDMSLMEYTDPNNELLRRLSLEAPGTYQHSLVIGNLAESAARAIGANGLFCRVSTLYHDIGKLINPHYFTENQLGGFNIHQLLTPLESTHVIIAHVGEGEALARKHHLPNSFIDIIKEHHGTTLVYYFYCKQVELMGGDPSQVEEKQFRYKGPKPHTKESAIIMIADCIEAASRSLDEMSESTIAHMVERIVSDRTEDGQLSESLLTFEELGVVKKTMVKTLLVASHLRIKYPEKNLSLQKADFQAS